MSHLTDEETEGQKLRVACLFKVTTLARGECQKDFCLLQRLEANTAMSTATLGLALTALSTLLKTKLRHFLNLCLCLLDSAI